MSLEEAGQFNSADTSGRFRPTTDICTRYQTVLFDFDH